MAKKKRRRRRPTAQARKQLAADILAGTISGLIVLAVQKTAELVKARGAEARTSAPQI